MGHGTDARLTANHLWSIRDHDIAFIRVIAIYRNLFARIYMRGDLRYIEVLDWNHSTSSAHYKALIFPGTPAPIVRLCFIVSALADDIPIFSIPSDSFQVIDFWHVPETTS